MNDEEDIMKKLQKVANRDCNFCWQKGENCDGEECEKVIAEKILNIYNRQQADIERLNGNLFTISNACMQRRNEAIKEFAERLKIDWQENDFYWEEADVYKWIDEVLSEMEGVEK